MNDPNDWSLAALAHSRSKLLRVFYASHDFQVAGSALTWLLEEWDPDQGLSRIQLRKLKCFKTSAIIAFMRPFSEGFGHVALSRKIIGLKFSEEEHRIFKKVKTLRHKLVAHSDEEQMHFRVDPITLDRGQVVLQITFDEGFLLSHEEIMGFLDLTRRASFAVAKTIFCFTERFPEQATFYQRPNP